MYRLHVTFLVILLKGIRDITLSDRILKEAHDDFIRFSTNRSQVSDSGTYCIVARNEHGSDRAFVTITVKSPKQKKSELTMSEKGKRIERLIQYLFNN